MGDYEDFDACVADNQDKRDPEAYCAAIKRQIEGAAELSDRDREVITASDHYSDRLLDETPCWDNYTMVGTKTVDGREVPNCVPDDDVPDANLAAADDRCGEGRVRIGNRCVDLSRVTSGDDDVPPSVLSDGRMLAEFDAGDAVSWSWQGETVHGRVSEINEEQATVGDVTIEGDPDDEEPVYVIDEYDDEAGGFRSSNVAKPESSLNESQRDLPDRTEDNMLAAAQHLQLKSLESEPIERVEDGGDTVRYRNLKLLSPGIWADAGSQTETYYPPEGIAALQAHYDESEHDGPPILTPRSGTTTRRRSPVTSTRRRSTRTTTATCSAISSWTRARARASSPTRTCGRRWRRAARSASAARVSRFRPKASSSHTTPSVTCHASTAAD